MLLSSTETLELIPQKDPMIMVGALLEITNGKLKTEFRIPVNHILLDKNRCLSPSALIENIAQTAAVNAGYKAKINQEKPKKGFIGAIKNFEIFGKALAGDVLETSIHLKNEIFNASIIEGEIICKNQLIAKGEMKIFLIDEA
jgi:3-hydroxymyristoyl/3-hydroxydecanoyl-(acyl carrier protein) dehydratase